MLKIHSVNLFCLLIVYVISLHKNNHFQISKNDFCWMKTYDRPSVPPTKCPSGYEYLNTSTTPGFVFGRCFVSCPLGYIRKGQDCTKVCAKTDKLCVAFISGTKNPTLNPTCLGPNDSQLG
jgi:hypothetical protein